MGVLEQQGQAQVEAQEVLLKQELMGMTLLVTEVVVHLLGHREMETTLQVITRGQMVQAVQQVEHTLIATAFISSIFCDNYRVEF